MATSWIRKAFFKKSAKEPFNIVEIEHSELSGAAFTLEDIWNDDITGVIIRNALAEEECQSICDHFESLPADQQCETTSGAIVAPTPFSMVQQTHSSPQEVENYFARCPQFWKDFSSQAGFDFIQKISRVLQELSDGQQVSAPMGPNQAGSFAPGSIRKLIPHQGELNMHCGNHFHHEYPEVFAQLALQTELEDQLSYFYTLQPADHDGELIIYDLCWDEVKKRLPGGLKFEDLDGKVYDSRNEDEVTRKVVSLGQGDLFIFSGGKWWHRVSVPTSTVPRYTLGGFITKSLNDKGLHIWT